MKKIIFVLLIIFTVMTAIDYCSLDIVNLEQVTMRVGRCTLETGIVFQPQENVFTSKLYNHM